MPAETNANQSFSVRQVPWWDTTGESVKDDYPLTLAQAMDWSATSGWDAVAEEVYKKRIIDLGNGEYEALYDKIDGAQRITRSDDNTIDLGMVGKVWAPIPNSTPFELVAHMLDTRPFGPDGEVPLIDLETQIFTDLGIKIETAGYLNDGQEIWVCGLLDDPVVLPGDFSGTQQFVVAVMANDGTGSLRVFSTFIRTVCKNTMQAGEMQAGDDNTLYTFRHSAKWGERVEAAKLTIRGSRENLHKLADIYAELDSVHVDDETTEDFIATLIPMETTATTRSRNNILRDRGKLRTFLHSPSTAPMSDKALGLWMASGEFFDHGRRYRSQASYVRRTLFDAQKGKLIALDILHDLTGAKVGPSYEAQEKEAVIVS